MPTDDQTPGDVGRDPLAPDDLVAPPEPTEPPRGERPGHRSGELREPTRLPETSVRRIDHRSTDSEATAAGGLHEVTEPQPTMGATLAEERRRQGKSLMDVEAATRIRGRLIEAMEKGEYDSLPSSAYVKGYIQSYADFLEIPSGPLVAQFNAETAGRDAKAQEHPYIKFPLPATASVRKAPKRSRSGGGRGGDLQLPGGRLWIWVLALLIVVASAIGIAGLLNGRGDKVEPLPNPVVVPSKTATGAAGETTGSTGPTGSVNPADLLPPGAYVVVVKVKPNRSSTVKIVSAGHSLYNGVLRDGASKTVTPTADATVRLGVPTAATVTLNGTDVKVPSNGGQPVTLHLSHP